MHLFNQEIKADTNIFLFGDSHEGSSARYKRGWEQLVSMINSPFMDCPNNIGVSMGDDIEAIMVDDKRYSDIGITHDKVLRQIENAIKNLEPIKDKVICMLTGNHEMKLWRFGNITEHIAGRLGVRYGEWTSIITYKDKKGKEVFNHYCCHGTKSVSSQAGPKKRKRTNREVRLQDLLKDLNHSCYLMCQGDIHQLIISPPDNSLYLYCDNNNLKSGYSNDAIQQVGRYLHEDLRWYVSTGTFSRTYIKKGITWAETKGFPPTQLGFAVAIIRDYKLVDVKPVYLK